MSLDWRLDDPYFISTSYELLRQMNLYSLELQFLLFLELEGLLDLMMILAFFPFVSQKVSFKGNLNSFWWRWKNLELDGFWWDDNNDEMMMVVMILIEIGWWLKMSEMSFISRISKMGFNERLEVLKMIWDEINEWKKVKCTLKRFKMWFLVSWFESYYQCDLNHAFKNFKKMDCDLNHIKLVTRMSLYSAKTYNLQTLWFKSCYIGNLNNEAKFWKILMHEKWI